MVADDKNEEQGLRAAALKNAEAIVIARQRAERALVAANAELERKADELQQQRNWFEVTLSSIGDAVITTDTRCNVTFLNPAAETMTGWSSAAARSQPLDEVFRIVNEDTGMAVASPVRKVLETGQIVGLANHTVLISRDGSVTPIEDSAAPIRDSKGDISGVVMVFHDVTRRRSAERALRASEERFRATFNQAAMGIAVTGLDGHFVEANQRFSDMLGYPADELRSLTVMDITHPVDRAATAAQMQRLLAGEIARYILEKRYVRKDQTHVWSRTTVALLRDGNGQPAQLIAIVDDITERKQAEEIRGRLAAVVESSDDAIISKTLQGIIVTWNQGAQRMFGYTADEVIGKSIEILIPPDHANEEPRILERLRRGERIDHYETDRVTKDGTLLHVSLTVSPLKDFKGTIVGASKIARDITQQKRAAESLRDLYQSAQREIENRERAEAALRENDRRKDEFLATLAHELRNPLAPIRQAALISKASSATEAQKRWSHDVISRQVHHMALLLDDLLDISRITRGTLELRTEITELAAVVDAAIETARPAVDARRHQFFVETPQELVHFVADPLRLAQVLSNLLTNAAKYTDPEGQIRLRAVCNDTTLVISVSDTGIGIPPEQLGQVFAMFSQVKSSQDRSEGGLGIGLALAKGLVELHGGSLEATSAGTGLGSEFIVRLPLRRIATRAQTDVAQPTGSDGIIKRRVLIADDNRDAAESLAILLRLEGHEVAIVHDGREALAAVAAMKPEVALLDIGMPELNGYEVARQIRAGSFGRAMVLVAVTGWGQSSDKARALAAGFDHHFTKPVQPGKLSELLRLNV